MKKGQISLDFAIALVAAIVFFSAFSIYVDGLSKNINESTTKNELKTILLDSYIVLGSAKAFKETIDYNSLALTLTEKKKAVECIIEIDGTGTNGTLKVSSGNLSESYEGLDFGNLKIDLKDGTGEKQISRNPDPIKFNCRQQVTLKGE